jgi:hypothetical protein
MSESAYSTLGGTSGKTVLVIIPSASIKRLIGSGASRAECGRLAIRDYCCQPKRRVERGKLSRNAEDITGTRMGRVLSEQPSIIDLEEYI